MWSMSDGARYHRT